jgi:hypothetical protein
MMWKYREFYFWSDQDSSTTTDGGLIDFGVTNVRKANHFLIITVACLFLFPMGADAQTLGRMIQRTGLSQQDVNIMTSAGSALYASGNARVGDDAIWSNPNTGAFGMAEVLAIEENCVRMAYRFQTQRRPMTQTITIRRCLVGERWLLSN